MSGPPPNPSFPSLYPQINAGTSIPRPDQVFGSAGGGLPREGAQIRRGPRAEARCPYCGRKRFQLRKPRLSGCVFLFWLFVPPVGQLWFLYRWARTARDAAASPPGPSGGMEPGLVRFLGLPHAGHLGSVGWACGAGAPGSLPGWT